MFRWQRYKLFLVSLHISSLFCCFALCKDEFRVEILVKGNGCGERFALLAGETIERSGLALGEQVGDVGTHGFREFELETMMKLNSASKIFRCSCRGER